jgi:hypothetical protein
MSLATSHEKIIPELDSENAHQLSRVIGLASSVVIEHADHKLRIEIALLAELMF